MWTRLRNQLIRQMSKPTGPSKAYASKQQSSRVNLAIDHLEDRTACDIGLGWAAVIGSPGLNDYVRDHAVDSLGNLYVIGSFDQSIDLDLGPGSSIITSSGGVDAFMAKYTPDGRLSWGGSLSGSNLAKSEFALSIEITDTDRIFVMGQFSDIIDLSPHLLSGIMEYGNANSSNLFIAEYDVDGGVKGRNTILAKEADTVYAGDLEFDQANNRLIVTGTLDGQATFGKDAGGPTLSSPQTDVFVASFGIDLKTMWAKTLPGTGVDLAEGLAVHSGSIYVSGNFYGTMDANPNAGVHTLASTGLSDIFLVKLTSAGNFSSAFSIGGSGNDQVANIEIDSSSNLYIGGLFSDTVDFDPTAATFQISAHGNKFDAFLMKYDLYDGELTWAKRIGTNAPEEFSDFTIDKHSNLIAALSTVGPVDADPNVGVYTVGQDGKWSSILLQLNKNGELQFAKQLGSVWNAADLSIDQHGSYYVSGIFGNTIDFAPGPETFNLTANGTYDAFVVKLTPRMDLLGRTPGGSLWAAKNNGTNFENISLGKFDLPSGVTAGEIKTVDVNYDSLTDLVTLASNGTWYARLGTRDGFAPTSVLSSWAAIEWRDMQVADFNGDGRADLLARTYTGEWWLSKNAGNSYVTSKVGQWFERAGWKDVMVADMNLDGDVDIIARTSTSQWWVALNNGDGTLSNDLFGTWSNLDWKDVGLAYLDGPKAQPMVVGRYAGEWWGTNNFGFGAVTKKLTTWNEAAGWRDVVFADFNGDGLDDIAGRTSSGGWWISQRNPDKTFTTYKFGAWDESVVWKDVILADFNGDGKKDFVGRNGLGEIWVSQTGVSNNTISTTLKKMGAWSPAVDWNNVLAGPLYR